MNIELIILTPIFITLFIVIRKIGERNFGFDFPSSILFGGCVATLCVMGMSQAFHGKIAPLLVPYAALGICIITMLILPQTWRPGRKYEDDDFGNKKNYTKNISEPEMEERLRR